MAWNPKTNDCQSNGPEQAVTVMNKVSTTAEHITVVEPNRAEKHYWRDLLAYKELFAVLAWYYVPVRYRQTIIGFAWAILRPFLTMVVFTVIFGKVAKLPSDGGTPCAAMVFAGMT